MRAFVTGLLWGSLAVVLLFGVARFAIAAPLHNPQQGFSLDVPDDFVERPLPEEAGPQLLHLFTRRGSDGQGDAWLTILRAGRNVEQEQAEWRVRAEENYLIQRSYLEPLTIQAAADRPADVEDQRPLRVQRARVPATPRDIEIRLQSRTMPTGEMEQTMNSIVASLHVPDPSEAQPFPLWAKALAYFLVALAVIIVAVVRPG